MTSSLLPLEHLDQEEIQGFGRVLTPYRAEFRGKLLCAVDPGGDVVIKGLLRFSGQKDNYLQVVDALNLTHNRGQVVALGLTTATSVVHTFFTSHLDAPSDVIDIATTFICDDLRLHEIARRDVGLALHKFAHACVNLPLLILTSIHKAERMALIDEKLTVAKKQQ